MCVWYDVIVTVSMQRLEDTFEECFFHLCENSGGFELKSSGLYPQPFTPSTISATHKHFHNSVPISLVSLLPVIPGEDTQYLSSGLFQQPATCLQTPIPDSILVCHLDGSRMDFQNVTDPYPHPAM